jgi:hypothetical protein
VAGRDKEGELKRRDKEGELKRRDHGEGDGESGEEWEGGVAGRAKEGDGESGEELKCLYLTKYER